MKETLKKTLAYVIALNLAVSSISVPNTAVKAEENKAVASETVSTEGYSEPTVVEEVVSDRTADSITVLLSNGMKQTTYYSDDIYYQNAEGEYAEYDNELKQLDSDDKKDLIKSIEVKKSEKDDYKYVNTEGDSKQYLPKELSEDTPVVMTKENYVLSFAPADDGENPKDNTDGNALSGSTGKVSLEAQEIENIYEDNNAEEKKVLANYSDKTENLDLCYESLSHGMKETIVLNERPESNIFEFSMTLQGMYAKVDEEGGAITIYSNDEDDIVGGIEAPFMNDASEENYSENLHYELTEESGTQDGIHKYILKLVVDESYLDSEKTVYPVSIDPSVTWSGTSDLPETYVLKSSSGTNYFSSGVKTFSVGKGSQGVFRSYMRAKALANTVDGKYIDSAILTVYENGANVSGVKINIKPAASSFACKTVTWANQPGGTSAVLASFKSKGISGTKHEINLKTWAQNVAKGSGDGNKNYGLLFRVENESASSYVRFYGARTDTTSKKPTLKVVYYDGPTTASSVSAVSGANAGRTYLQAGESLKVSWSGISSHALSYVQYRIENASGTNVVQYSDSTKLGTTASGTKTISVSSLAEGKYKIYVRGVDKGGIKGTGKSATFYIDKTAPVIMSLSLDPAYSNGQYSDEEPEISWNVKESNISSIQVSVNSGAYKTIGTENNDSGDITGLISGKVNLISVRAIDKAGNVSAYSGYQYPYDCDEPIITMSISTNTNENKYDNSSDKPTLTYNISDSTLKSYSLLVNDEEQKLTASKGSVKLENIEEGENSITISAVDKADNESEEEIIYYRDVTDPEKGTVKITPKTGFFNSSNSLPTVAWSGFEDDNLSEVQVKIDDGTYQTLGYEPNGEAKLQEKDFEKDGRYNIKVRAVDKAGNTSGDVSYNYYYETTDYALEDYTPMNVYAVEQIGGNTVLRFSTQSGKFNDSIKYQVYRGTTPLFVPDNNTLVKTVSSKGAVKVSGDENKTYYYKVRAVRIKESQTQYSAFSEEISSTTLSIEEVSDRLGNNSLYEYASVSTPNGTGYVELTKGNFLYEQNDITLPAPQIPVNIARVYNSKSREVSSFGYGWSDAYDMYISETADKIYYSDGTKATYTFTKEGDTYRCTENPELSLEIDDDILYKTIEKKDTDGNVINKTDLELDVYYKITEKEGEIYRFDNCGRLILIEESNDTFVYIKYNEKNGKIAEVTTGSGQKAEYSYNEEGLINMITAAKGTESEYSYQYTYESGYLKKATFVGIKGGTIDYNYSYIDGKLSVITDAEGNVYHTEYDSNYNVISKFVYPNGEYNVYSFTENQEKSRPRTTISKFNDNDSKLGEEEYYFSISGLLTEKTDVCGNKSEYKYDDKNNRISEAERSTYYALVGDTVVKKTITKSEGTVYDTHGNITKQTETDGSITKFVYDYSKGRAECVINLPTEMTETDANGNVNSHELYQYDEQGNTVKVIDKITNTITNYTYNSDGTVDTSKETFVEDTESKNTVASGLEVYSDDTEYNADGDELSESSFEGTVDEEIVYTYDEIGNVITETDKTNNITTAYEYDEFLRTIKTTETAQVNGKETKKVTESGYNKNGSQIKSVDEEGRITEYTYDSMNRAIETKLTVGEDEKITKTAYSYGSVSINTGKGTMTVENTMIITVTNTSDEVVGKTYTDSLGRTIRELSNGLYVDYTYDNSGRVFTTYTGGNNETDIEGIAEGKLSVSTYDANGNQTDTIINPEITGDTFKVGESSIVTSNEYDATGMLIKSTDANGNSTCYTYDEQGRVIKVITAAGTGNQYSYDNIEKDAEGNIISIVETVTDALGSVIKKTTNGAEQVLSIKDETTSGNIETTYEYDVNGQKVKESYNDGSWLTFAYDVYGNNIKKSAFDTEGNEKNTTEYVYDGESNLIETVDSKNGTPYRYTFYEYDVYGRNISVAEINAASRPSDSTIENAKLKYVYNIDDNIEKIYYPNASKDKLKGISFKYNKDKWITEIDGLLSGGGTQRLLEKMNIIVMEKYPVLRISKTF